MSTIENYRVLTGEVRCLLKPSVEAGLDQSQLLEELHLSRDFLADDEGTINIDDCWRIFNAQYNLTKEESHLLSRRPLLRGTTRLIFNNLLNCKNLYEGLISVADAYNVIHGGRFNLVKKHGNSLSFIVDDRDFHYVGAPNFFAIEFALLRLHCALSVLANRPLKLRRVCTVRESLPIVQHHLNLFSTEVVTNYETYALVYHASEMDVTFDIDERTDINGNLLSAYLTLLSTHDDESDFVLRVKESLSERGLRRQPFDQATIAELMHVSVATFRRRLKESGVSFREILDRSNAELAVNALHELRSSEKAAQHLGYCDTRSFKRAFKRWHRMSPAEYMQKHGISVERAPRRPGV